MATLTVASSASICEVTGKTGTRTGLAFQRVPSGTLVTVSDTNHQLTSKEVVSIFNSSVSVSATWTRSGTTATITSSAHGLAAGNIIYVSASSSTAAITLANKTVASPLTDTFTFTCLNAGDVSGTLTYEVSVINTNYTTLTLGGPIVAGATWTRATTTATVTSVGHGMSGAGNTVYVIVSSSTAAITVASKTVTVTGNDTFTFTCLNAGDASGTISYIRTNNLTQYDTFSFTGINSGTVGLSGTVSYMTGDNYTVSAGATLTIDCDSRYGANQQTATVLKNITLSAGKASLSIDGRYVRLIPYNSGSGNVPVGDTVITQGSASGKLIGVWSSLTTAPTAAGAAMPASGWIKIRAWNSTAYSSGALTGIGASATGADVVGWIDVAGADTYSISFTDISNDCSLTGSWYLLGTTDGTSDTVYQIPTSGLLCYMGAVFVETGSGTNAFEPYTNMGTITTCGTEAARGKVCWITNTGAVYIGKNSSSEAYGYIPPSGRKVVIGNVLCHSTTGTLRQWEANTLPNTTPADRYEFGTGSNVMIDKVSGNWCWYFVSGNALEISNSLFVHPVSVESNKRPVIITDIGIGSRSDTNLSLSAFYTTNCLDGTFERVTASNYRTEDVGMINISNCKDLYYKDCITRITGNSSAASGLMIDAAGGYNITFDGITVIANQGLDTDTLATLGTAMGPVTFKNYQYISKWYGTTGTTASYALLIQSGCKELVIDGYSEPVASCGPYTRFIQLEGAYPNAIIRNIGTREAPIDRSGYASAKPLYFDSNIGSVGNLSIQRVYFSNVASGSAGLLEFTGSEPNNVTMTDVVSVDTQTIAGINARSVRIRGCDGLLDLTAKTGAYGTIWADTYTTDSGDSAGRIYLKMNAPYATDDAEVVLSGGAYFDGAGGLVLPTTNDSAEYTMPYYALGHTGFQNTDAVMAGGTIGNYTLTYKIDVNDGTGFGGSWTSLTGANLSAISTINPLKGFKLKIKIVNSTPSTSAITSLYLKTTTTATSRTYEYPLAGTTAENVWAYPVDGTFTAADVLRMLAAVMAGQTTITPGGGGAATVVFRDLSDSLNRLTATMDGSERTAMAHSLLLPGYSVDGTTGESVWEETVDGTYTAKQVLKILAATLAGKTTITPGLGDTATVVFRNLSDTVDAVEADMDGSERTALSYNV